MKKFSPQFWLLALCVLVFTSCSKESIEENETSDLLTEITPVNYNAIEIEVMDRINDYRLSKGLPGLNFIDEISWQAEDHNFHMIDEDEVCHDGFPGRSSALTNSLNAQSVSENVAYGYSTAEAVVNAWIKSDGHRKNIESDVTHFGISVKEDSEGKLYFTNIFVRR